MEFLFVPEALVLFQVKVVHTWLSNLVVCGTSLDDLPFVTVVQRQIEITKAGLAVQPGSDVSEESEQRGRIGGVPNLLREGQGGDRDYISKQEGDRYQVTDSWSRAAVQDVTDPQNGLQNGVPHGEEDPKV